MGLRKAVFMTQNHPLHPALSDNEASAAMEWLSHTGNHFLTCHEPCYPSLLRETADPPPFLFVTGCLSLLNKPIVALVGSRNATRQGCLDAEAFAQALSEAGVTVVSGLAVGVDGAAHQGALGGTGGTIAVLGTGVDRVYPSGHRELAHTIARKGALISEFPLGMGPQKWHFPKRNRIIAGLSLGCLVVEASLSSGSLITARLALEAGREVFAIPGSIHSPFSKGCHQLIKEGAKLVETVQDILDELPFNALKVQALGSFESVRPIPVPADITGLLWAELGQCNLSPNELSLRLGLTIGQVSLMLTSLELAGQVAAVPGGRYQRLDSGRGRPHPAPGWQSLKEGGIDG